MKKVILGSFLLAVSLFIVLNSVLAVEGKAQSGVSLEKRVEILEGEVAGLQKIVARLEQNAPGALTNETGQTTRAPKATWRSLRKGMTKADVRDLFGEPGKIVAMPFSKGEIWYYPDALVSCPTNELQ